jgi:hypothetical protein
MAARTGEIADEKAEAGFVKTGLMDKWIVGLMKCSERQPKNPLIHQSKNSIDL